MTDHDLKENIKQPLPARSAAATLSGVFVQKGGRCLREIMRLVRQAQRRAFLHAPDAFDIAKKQQLGEFERFGATHRGGKCCAEHLWCPIGSGSLASGSPNTTP